MAPTSYTFATQFWSPAGWEETETTHAMHAHNMFTTPATSGSFNFWQSKTHAPTQKYLNSGGEAEIRKHLFFRHIDWDKIARLEVQPPFKPRIRDRFDVSNFDRQFTNQKVQLSPTDESIMMDLDQSIFNGFSYTCDDFHYPESDEDDKILIDQCHRLSLSLVTNAQQQQKSS